MVSVWWRAVLRPDTCPPAVGERGGPRRSRCPCVLALQPVLDDGGWCTPAFTQSSWWRHGAFTRHGDTERGPGRTSPLPPPLTAERGTTAGGIRRRVLPFQVCSWHYGPRLHSPTNPPSVRGTAGCSPRRKRAAARRVGLAAVCPPSRALDRAAISVVREDLGHSGLLTALRPGDGSSSGLPV
jgi:hypothetical protein